jgi:hypothetical protein
MSERVPKWVTDLALDIYKVIQKPGAMDRFREMVNMWASKHEGDINNHLEWEERRRQYFQQLLSSDPRLLDESSGPPEQGWQCEAYVLRTLADSASGSEIRSTIIKGWVPPELSVGAEPEIPYPLPLSADHELTLEEKYVVLAAVYDVGRKGTEQIPPCEWPQDWGEEGAISNAKKSIFFESLRRDVSELSADHEGWLRILLDCVKRDIEGRTKQDVIEQGKDMASDETRVEGWIRRVKDHRVMSILIIAGVAIIALGAVAGGLDTIITFWAKHISMRDVPQQSASQGIWERTIVSATASVEINVRSDEQINAHNMNRGLLLAFTKEKKVLLLMESEDSYAKQIGEGTVQYSGNVRMSLTDKAFNQPLSILRDARYVQLQVEVIPANSDIVSGKINCAFNDGIPATVVVPPQRMRGNVIMVQDIDFAQLVKN